MRSRDNLKSYLHYHNIYGHKTRQDDDLPLVTFTHKLTWTQSRDYIITI